MARDTRDSIALIGVLTGTLLLGAPAFADQDKPPAPDKTAPGSSSNPEAPNEAPNEGAKRPDAPMPAPASPAPASPAPADKRSPTGAEPTATVPPERLAIPDKLVADDPDTLVINVVGDISYPNGWGGIRHIDDKKHALFALVQPILDAAHLNFANIECPLTESEAVVEKEFPIACKEKRLDYMVRAGFNLFSLANNHSYDAGVAGITDSIALLERTTSERAPLWWAGTGENATAARRHTLVQAPGKNTRIAFFAVANSSYRGKVASLHDPSLPERLAAAKRDADLVLISIHYGPEYVHVPSKGTVGKYQRLIDAGADIVIAHHPHVVQGVERYKDGFIFYSLGNFSFGSKTRRHLVKGARLYSMIGRMTFYKGVLARVELIPLYANNGYRWTLGDRTIPPRHATPQLLAGDFAQAALDEFEAFTRKVPTASETRLVRIGDRAFVDLGTGALSDATRAESLHTQMHEYAAVMAATAEPRPATAGEMRVKGRGGTPDAAVRAAQEKAAREKKGKRGKRSKKGNRKRATNKGRRGKRSKKRPRKRKR